MFHLCYYYRNKKFFVSVSLYFVSVLPQVDPDLTSRNPKLQAHVLVARWSWKVVGLGE